MNRAEVIEKAMRANGHYFLDGHRPASLAPLMPWLVMDQMYNGVFKETLLGAPLRHKAKQERNALDALYKKYNHAFWGGMDEETPGEVVDLMDKLEAAIHNDLVRLRLAARSATPEELGDMRDAVAGAYTCQVLCHIANSMYYQSFRRLRTSWDRRVVLDSNGEAIWDRKGDERLSGMAHRCIECYNAIASQRGVQLRPYTSAVAEHTTALCRHIVRWLKNEDAEYLKSLEGQK